MGPVRPPMVCLWEAGSRAIHYFPYCTWSMPILDAARYAVPPLHGHLRTHHLKVPILTRSDSSFACLNGRDHRGERLVNDSK